MKKLISLILVLVLALTVAASLAEEPAATPLDKEAFDALLAEGPVASDEAIAASAWATKVKEAGILRVGGTRTSFLFSQLDETDNSIRGFDAALYQLDVAEDQLEVDGLDVACGIDRSFDVDDVVVVKTAHHVDDRVAFADVRKELVAQSLAL